MVKKFCKLLSVLLVMALLVQLMPVNVLAAGGLTIGDMTADDNAVLQPPQAEPVPQILLELEDRRTASSKEFLMNNGLHMAVLYPEPVHYATDAGWEEIDNTLKATEDGYANTAGAWQVTFPQSIHGGNAVTVTRDGYTLSFSLAGQLLVSDSPSLMAEGGAEAFSLQEALEVTAQVVQPNAQPGKEDPQAMPAKVSSRVQYAGAFAGADIVYDLSGSQVKESVVLESYNADLRGYRYTLNTGSMTPVLAENGRIDLYDGEEAVMSMPAPYLQDAAGEISCDVTVTLTGSDGSYVLSYLLPQGWLAEESRAWPVVLDPAVQPDLDVNNIKDVSVYQRNTPENYLSGILDHGYNSSYGIMRTYLMYEDLPVLTSADVVVGAQLQMSKPQNSPNATVAQVHKVGSAWDVQTLNWNNQPALSDVAEDYCIIQNTGHYEFTVTDIVRGWYESGNTGLTIRAPKAIEETTSTTSYRRQFYSSDFNAQSPEHAPVLTIWFRNNNGLEGYWDYTASSAGRAGTGYVNSFAGNMVLIRPDMAFGGSRMPVSITHVYNANDAANNDFGMGYGWRTNFHQRITPVQLSGEQYYAWEDSDGTTHYFYEKDGEYVDEDGLSLTLTVNGTGDKTYTITDVNGNCSYFDASGRLKLLENNQETQSTITISYSGTTNRITQITDGVGRRYTFTYNSSNLLSRLCFYGKNLQELSYVNYTYSGGNLTGIEDKDGKSVSYGYNAGHILTTAQDIDGYKLTYTYNTPEAYQPYRVLRVTESHGGVDGGELTFAYGHNETTLTDHNGNKQILQFNDFGNTVSVHDGQGRAQHAQYALNTDAEKNANENPTYKGNQLRMSSKMQNTVGSTQITGSFESNMSGWYSNSANMSAVRTNSEAWFGSYSVLLTNATDANYAFLGKSVQAAPGESYTFSAWVKGSGAKGFIAVYDSTGNGITQGTSIKADQPWTRLQVTYTNKSTTTRSISPAFFVTDPGSLYVDGCQMEKAETASRYNLAENGDFRNGTSGWTTTEVLSGDGIVTQESAAPQLDSNALKLTGAPTGTNRISQTVTVSGQAGDTFVLAGWAKASSAPILSDNTQHNNRRFALKAIFRNTDGTTTERLVSFNPDANTWQYAAAPVIAEKAYSSMQIVAEYSHNVNTAYFDGIQLYKEAFGSSYTYDENGNVKSVVDIQKQQTTYAYEGNDLTEAILPTGITLTYDYDQYHNVTTATSTAGQVYNFTYDTYGNNTTVSISSAAGTMRSEAEYTDDGNLLSATIDALDNVTVYRYNENTGLLEWIRYPGDRIAQRTEYTYDDMCRLVQSKMDPDGKTSTANSLSAAYTYENDLLAAITTPTTTYSFSYGNFSLRESIAIGSHTLATYAYTNDRNNYLQALTYGNNDRVSYAYDSYGRLTTQTYEDGDTVTYTYDNTGALARVKDSATGITTTYYYDFTDRLMRYTESASGYSHAVGYAYDTVNNLTSLVETINGQDYTTSYTYDDHNRIYSVTTGNTTKTYTYDALGRVTQKCTTQSGDEIMLEEFTYNPGANGGTTSQVETYTVETESSVTTYTYTYDVKGNILSVSDGMYTTTYAYDAANQLIREDNPYSNLTTAWTYDNAGNILTCYEYAYTTGSLSNASAQSAIAYTYGDDAWGDLLTAYNGQAITSDTIGNTLNDGEWSYNWEHGRQLASMTDGEETWAFTYNSDGLRTQRTNGTTTYNYTYNGSQLTHLTVGDNELHFSYDASGSPMTLTYNGETYYYGLNLQGDVVGIYTADGTQVVAYTYDAWGNILSTSGSMATTLGTLNPLRYRGYVYDQETGLYYLQSRYYNPKVGRFINADAFASTGQGLLSNNMFAYCFNNPANKADYTGTAPGDLFPSAEDAAGNFAQYMNPRSIEENTEYVTCIRKRTIASIEYVEFSIAGPSWMVDITKAILIALTGSSHIPVLKLERKYYYAQEDIIIGGAETVMFTADWYYDADVVATAHTHAAYLDSPTVINDGFSTGDKTTAIQMMKPVYLATPRGTFLCYDPFKDESFPIPIYLEPDPNHPAFAG